MSRQRHDWLFALVLTIPMVALYIALYFHHSSDLYATGFLSLDNISYVANAKQYLDAEKFSLFYSNPLNDSGNYQPIYFQTQTIFMALLLWIGFAPGLTIVLTNWLGTLLSFRMAIKIYDLLYPNSSHRKLFLSFFCWGGGLVALACIPIALVKPMGDIDFLDRMFFIDPAWGWWGLNFGRGHIISTEGYYHFLFLSGVYCILKKKWNLALLSSLLLSLSHPFTGVEYLSIILVWTAIEKFFWKNKTIPWTFLLGTGLVMAFHLFYYLFYLNQFPEHHSVSEQYALNWRLRFFSMIPAYCLVGTLAVVTVTREKKSFFHLPQTRLFFTWFFIAFLLVNHELFMRPMQPLHFTRGYVWTSLFLLGLPALHRFFEDKRVKSYSLVLPLASVLLLSDNFLWIINQIRFKRTNPSDSYITWEQKNLLEVIDKNSDNKTLVVGRDGIVALVPVFSKAYPWISHPFTTPFAAIKTKAFNDFIENGTIDSAWKKRDVIFLFHKSAPEEMRRSQSLPFSVKTLASTNSYILQKAAIPQ